MSVIKKIFTFLLIAFIAVLLLLYLAFLFILPQTVNSQCFHNFIQRKINSKNTQYSIILPDKIQLKTNKDLSYNLKLSQNDMRLDFSGKILGLQNYQILIKGSDVPIKELEETLLSFQKLKKKDKVFIENFKDFSGTVDVDLIYKKSGLYGKCHAKKLSAVSLLYNVPIVFDDAIFYFNDRHIESHAYGTIGGEKLYSSFELKNLATSKQTVSGIVRASLNNNFVKTYIPDFKIEKIAQTSVNYFVKNKKVNVNYLLKLSKGSDIYYKDAYLGMKDKNRRLFVRTLKDGDIITVTEYDYSLVEGANINKILIGNGLFKKENGVFALQNLNCKTNGYAPVSVTGSFGKYVSGGEFDGDVYYDAKKNQLTGDFSLKNTRYKKFKIKNSYVNANENIIKITASGSYEDSDFNWTVSALNDFNDRVHIYNMDLFIDSISIKNSKNNSNNNKNVDIDIADKVEDIKIDIDNWKVKLGKISHKRVTLKDVLLQGSLKRGVFKFSMPEVNFADGKMSASGKHNFNNDSSQVDFTAENINSDIVASKMFNLPNQIHGVACAKVHANLKDNFDDVKAHIKFSIADGYLLKLGSREFMIKKSRKIKRPIKFKVKDIINVDIKNAKSLSSNISGSFDMYNYDLNNIKLTSSQKYLGLYIEGKYNIKKQDAELRLYGKYNKSAQKGIRILFIPLSWIVKAVLRPEKTKDLYTDKLKLVPEIVANPKDESAFRVNLKGNINNNDVKVELKSII